ncbi:pyruvate, water dikinase [Actinokineospora alba]|uniref:Pyruvate, water dikinase n=1 Tax=Actinokineospora alba TaxID=504798 RepID=A0A1H0NFV3_9PSEU|nr:PEP/pyruvate-binding domain-containing protein [Actinokineospora alba]TDP68706.1 pyruvate,water dikinase [Actinokineospora alba]SDH84923.1 pyruvate, water dikinase [Actinokineospora alba]SDO91579.1 pyruvate, water dikinase [Actinokineospora alba]
MIERLSASTPIDPARIGGKGAGLVRLLCARLDVPEAWVIPASVSRNPEARAALFDGLLVDWWEEASEAHPGSRWAVRSSAVAEDLAEASFAGVYQTVLGVDSYDALSAAIRECWQALDDDRAKVYRDGKGIDGGGGIALVLQRLLAPTTAGVLLTTDPRKPFAPDIVIDASWGLGESVVSGKADPDQFVLDRATGAIRTVHIGAKQVELTWDGEREVDADRQTARCLSDDDVAGLYAMATQVESAIGSRRDLEWAIEDGRVYALQDRPITGLPSATPDNVWSRRFGDEYLSEYALPLSIDLLVKWIEDGFVIEMARLQKRPDLLRRKALRTHNGYAYFSGDYLMRMLAAFPVSLRANAASEWYTPLWRQKIDAQPFKPMMLANAMLAPYRDRGRGSMGKNPEALRTHCETIDTTIVPLLGQDYTALTAREWRRQYDEVNELGLNHFRVVRWGMGQYNPMLHGVLETLLRKWAGDEHGELYQAIIGGLSDTRTAELNREIWDLARLASGDGHLTEVLRGDTTYPASREKTVGATEFWSAFDAFLTRHGHRSSSREISALRWNESPDLVLGFVQAQLRCDPFPEDPRRTSARAKQRQEQALATAQQRAGRALRKSLLRKVSARTQLFTSYRENQRYHLDYLTSHIRLLVLEQGRRLTERGILTEPFDVFYLTGEEFFRLIDETVDEIVEAADVSALLAERRRHHQVHKDRRPATFLFDDVETEGEVDQPTDAGGDGLRGLGASRGVAKGPARAVTSLADLATVKPGDILVANNIDPGWTSVFPLIAGLVTETGGVLSHGAILAREYGIPTVTGVKDAVDKLESGSIVEVDGSAGAVRVLP